MKSFNSTNNEIWILADIENGSACAPFFELEAKARELQSQKNLKIAAVLVGGKLSKAVEQLKGKGVSKIYRASFPGLDEFYEETYAEIIADMARIHKPEIILGAATVKGRCLMPRVAALLETGLTADCTGLEINHESGKLYQTRPAFGGNILATIICETFPQMATVRPHVFKDSANRLPVEPEIIDFDASMPLLRKTIASSRLDKSNSVSLADSKIVVSVGMGAGGPEGVELVRQFAEKIGAGFGASRSVVDSGWLEYSHQVGQTGITVHPEIYIACGISGAIQHLVGMQNSDLIIAINNDPEAPVFNIADIALSGDLKEIIPELLLNL
jgi:electron transfer flavoprotein alpha subunit